MVMHQAPILVRSSTVGRRVVNRAMALIAVVAVAMLGNLRLQASEIGVNRVLDSDGLQQHAHSPMSTGDTASDSQFDAMLDADRTSDAADDASDDVQLVPAIYSWNPDVRFVYFRHVSKWM